MKQWFAVHTHSYQEQLAATQLAQQGFDVFSPSYQRRRRHARKVDFTLAPLFPRYIFVSLDLAIDGWQAVDSTRGVSYLLRVKGQPAALPAHTILALKARQDSNGLVSAEALALFTAGEQVRIVDGCFNGLTAVYEAMDDKQRVQLLLDFMGREMRVSVPLYAVEAI